MRRPASLTVTESLGSSARTRVESARPPQRTEPPPASPSRFPSSATWSTKPSEELEWVVPLKKSLRDIGCAKQFRSSWLTSSQATLRERGLGPQYEAALPKQYREAILSAVAGCWLPMDVAIAHYRACDTLAITDVELVEIGRLAMWRAHGTAISFLGHLAHGAGATPWTVLAGAPRIWSHTVDDGAFAAARLGPKDARIDFVGFPLAAIRYNRITMRGIVQASVELFCQKVYVREIPALCDDRSLALRLSWV